MKLLPQVQKEDPRLSRWKLSTNQFNRDWEFTWLAQNLTPIRGQKIHWRSVPVRPLLLLRRLLNSMHFVMHDIRKAILKDLQSCNNMTWRCRAPHTQSCLQATLRADEAMHSWHPSDLLALLRARAGVSMLPTEAPSDFTVRQTMHAPSS